MSGTPYGDGTPENMMVLPRGTYRFLQTEVRVQGVLTPPDANAFTFTDVRRIEDPDGNNVTASWVTNALDPTDPADVWDATHADYVGAQATPANTGLFAEKVSGNFTGRVGQKVKVPDNAEVTHGNANRRYKIVWGIRLLGQPIQDADGEYHEFFHVASAGVLVFGGGMVTTEEVTALYRAADTATIPPLITAASSIVESMLAQVDETAPDDPPQSLLCAVKFLTVLLLMGFEESTGRFVNSVSQGGMSLAFGSTENRKKWHEDMATKCLMAYLATKRIYALKFPVATVFRRSDYPDFVLRHVPWAWRDY